MKNIIKIIILIALLAAWIGTSLVIKQSCQVSTNASALTDQHIDSQVKSVSLVQRSDQVDHRTQLDSSVPNNDTQTVADDQHPDRGTFVHSKGSPFGSQSLQKDLDPEQNDYHDKLDQLDKPENKDVSTQQH